MKKEKATKRLRLSAEESQNRILDAALPLFSDEGFQHTSFQKIANALGVSQSAVMHHYPTKEKLLEAILRRIIAHNHALVSERIHVRLSARAALREHFLGNLEWALKFPREAQTILLLYYLAGYNETFSQLYSEILVAARNRIAGYLHAAQREGTRLTSDPESLSCLLHDALLGGIVNLVTQPGRRASDKAKLIARWDDLLKFQVFG